jgi:hypothetical protein
MITIVHCVCGVTSAWRAEEIAESQAKKLLGWQQATEDF